MNSTIKNSIHYLFSRITWFLFGTFVALVGGNCSSPEGFAIAKMSRRDELIGMHYMSVMRSFGVPYWDNRDTASDAFELVYLGNWGLYYQLSFEKSQVVAVAIYTK